MRYESLKLVGSNLFEITEKLEKTEKNGENGENDRYGTTRETTEEGINARLRCAV
jgi:hypothetical protein